MAVLRQVWKPKNMADGSKFRLALVRVSLTLTQDCCCCLLLFRSIVRSVVWLCRLDSRPPRVSPTFVMTLFLSTCV